MATGWLIQIVGQAAMFLKGNRFFLHYMCYQNRNMKTKTDRRVKKYCTIIIPETQHRKLKKLAKKRGLRMNAYVPKLITVALKSEQHGS